MRYIILFSICILIFSCKPPYVLTAEGGLRPKKSNFFHYKKHPFHLPENSAIDTNSIYLTQVQLTGANPDSIENYFVYYRFFSTGQLLISFLYDTFPTLKEINNIQKGTAGYYKLSGKKSVIRIECIEVINGGQRGLRRAKIVDGDLEIFTLNPRTFYGLVPYNSKTEKWKKYKIEGMTHPRPDW